MTELRIRVNEADLLRAGWPRDAVNALRGVIAVIGTSVSIGSVSDLETLILTTTSGAGRDANIASQLQALSDEVGQIKRQTNSFQQSVVQRLDALEAQIKRSPNLTPIQQQLNELRDFTFGAR